MILSGACQTQLPSFYWVEGTNHSSLSHWQWSSKTRRWPLLLQGHIPLSCSTSFPKGASGPSVATILVHEVLVHSPDAGNSTEGNMKSWGSHLPVSPMYRDSSEWVPPGLWTTPTCCVSPANSGALCTEGALCPISQVTNRSAKQYLPQYRSLEYISSNWPLGGHWLQVFEPISSPGFQSTSLLTYPVCILSFWWYRMV